MKVTKTKAIITVNKTEYEIIKVFCQTLTDIYENDAFADMGEIVENISYGKMDFKEFEFRFE